MQKFKKEYRTPPPTKTVYENLHSEKIGTVNTENYSVAAKCNISHAQFQNNCLFGRK